MERLCVILKNTTFVFDCLIITQNSNGKYVKIITASFSIAHQLKLV
jgi:hypothetical protein